MAEADTKEAAVVAETDTRVAGVAAEDWGRMQLVELWDTVEVPAHALGTVAEAFADYAAYGLAAVVSGDDTAMFRALGLTGPVPDLARVRRMAVHDMVAAGD